MRFVSAGDSGVVPVSSFKLYLLRTSTLTPKGSGLALGWKTSPRGAVDGNHPDDSTPAFAEMANPGTAFEGQWDEKAFFLRPEIRKVVRWPESFDRSRIFEAANIYAAGLLALHKQYAGWAGLQGLAAGIEELEARLAAARDNGRCLLSIGWGSGLLGKSSWLDTNNPEYRKILQQFALYNRALASNLPFPKTRRIVFLNGKPAALPGWVELEVA
jgi:CRISPR-associated protein Csm5